MQLRLVAAVLILTGATVFAQTNQGTITGTISDPAGAVVPGAQLQIKNCETGVIYSGGTSDTGNYVVVVPAGTYEIAVNLTGFRPRPESAARRSELRMLHAALDGCAGRDLRRFRTFLYSYRWLRQPAESLYPRLVSNIFNRLFFSQPASGGASASQAKSGHSQQQRPRSGDRRSLHVLREMQCG